MLNVGAKAPLFKAGSTHGEVDLEQYAGKRPIVLIFYPMDDTPGCTKQLCAVRDAKARYEAYGAVVFGVNPGTIESHQAFAAKHRYDFPLIVDKDHRIRKMYGIGKMFGLIAQQRTVYAIDLNGNIAYAEKGLRPTDEILQALERMSP